MIQFIELPTACPICGGPVAIRANNNSEFLVCTSATCPGKLINRLDHFCGKKGLDIKGLSKAILTKLIDWEWLNNINDLPKLKEHKDEWEKKPGFGVKSVQNILDAIDTALGEATFIKFISSLGIPLIGTTTAKEIYKHVKTYEEFREKVKTEFTFSDWPDFGLEMERALLDFDYTDADKFYNDYLSFEIPVETESKEETLIFKDKTFVITGKLNEFKNRVELKEYLEHLGGRVVETISSKTNYLINNDINSTSSKNVASKKLGIPIITEKDLMKMIKGE